MDAVNSALRVRVLYRLKKLLASDQNDSNTIHRFGAHSTQSEKVLSIMASFQAGENVGFGLMAQRAGL